MYRENRRWKRWLKLKGGNYMHWMMWIFWSCFAALFLGSYLVDVLTRRKYNFTKQEKTLNQNLAEADALREVGRHNDQGGMF